MQATITFGPYRLHPDGPRLYNGDEPVRLQPRPLAVLCYLAERPGTVVPREELLARIWAGTAVTRAVLKVAVRAVREALADDADAPRYIETVGREGYRWIAGANDDLVRAPADPVPASAAVMVGRVDDLTTLRGALERALAGARQLVFVSGEAGIGKTTLVDRFVAEVARGSVLVARGQCLEQYGEGEAYLPVLEAIGALLQQDGGPPIGDLLHRHAPTWMSQLPPHPLAEPAQPSEGEAGATMPARMLREMADALEVLTRDQALLLVLEDLQWSDRSTVDLIGCIARRRQPARLLIVATLRPAQATFHDHPLLDAKQELQACGLCSELSLGLLSRREVEEYVARRFAAIDDAQAERLAARIHERTEGNALFMVNVVNDLVARGLLVWRDGRWSIEGSIDEATERIPVGLQELLERRLHGLSADVRRVLEAASVAGDEFAVAAVAAALGRDVHDVEDVCETLASQRVLIAEAGVAEWPDGSFSGRYRFLHALYRQVLYDGIAQSRLVRLHHAVGLREESGHGGASDHAAQLAMHFARGRDPVRAVKYHQLAGAAALERHAPHEALAHFDAALGALAHLPAGAGRHEHELGLVLAGATLRMATKGYAAAETEHAFARARALCDVSPASASLPCVLRGLVSYHHVRAELADAHQLGVELLRHAAARPDDRALRIQAHYGHGATLFHMGALDAARDHFERALRDYDRSAHGEHVLVYGGYDPGIACSLWLAWTFAFVGRLDEAAACNRAGLELAERVTDPFSLAWARYAAGTTYQLFGDWEACESSSAEAVRLAEGHGFPHVLGMATINRGWALVMRGQAAAGSAMLRQGLAIVGATGALLVRPSYLGMLAGAAAREGDERAAAAYLDEALAEVARTGERLHEPGLLIAHSRLLAGRDPDGSDARAEECLRRACAVARGQGARLFELRGAVALARHCRRHGRPTDARDALAAASAVFADAKTITPEITAARDLLAELDAQGDVAARRTGGRRARPSPEL
jgi:DNA-binding winged helix-turn-helix (wHTH) protein/tetratricopeptide (TPR) repeat protein